MKLKSFFNPFEKAEEKTLLIIGLLGFAVISYLSFIFKNPVYGIYKIGMDEDLTFQAAVICAVTSYASAILVFFILGKIMNRNTRLIDVANAVLVSLLPMLVLMICANIPAVRNIEAEIINGAANPGNISLEIPDVLLISGFAFLSLLFLAYSITLLYNGFKTATNIKSWKQSAVFAIVLFFLSVATPLFIPYLNP